MKDYYSILEVSPMSTREEIKKQYRKMAKQFHPDKNANDAYAEAKFHDIKEAYETLTQPSKKEEWLKERWLNQVYHKGAGETAPLTPFTILDKAIKLERQVAGMDVFRMDHAGVVTALANLLSQEHMECLDKFKEIDMNRSIIRHMLLAMHPIPYNLLEPVLEKMEALADGDEDARSMISSFRKQHRQQLRKDRWTLPLVILATIAICLIIYISSR